MRDWPSWGEGVRLNAGEIGEQRPSGKIRIDDALLRSITAEPQNWQKVWMMESAQKTS